MSSSYVEQLSNIYGFESGAHEHYSSDPYVSEFPDATPAEVGIDYAYSGNYGVRVHSDTSQCVLCTYAIDASNKPAGDYLRMQFRMKVVTSPPSEEWSAFGTFYNAYSSNNTVLYMYMKDDRTIGCGSAPVSSTVYGSFALSLDTWYTIAILINTTSNTIEIRIYSANMDTLHETISASGLITRTGYYMYIYGLIFNNGITYSAINYGNAFDYYIDDVIYAGGGIYEGMNPSPIFPMITGDYQIKRRRINGDSATYSDWEGGDYTKVDDLPINSQNTDDSDSLYSFGVAVHYFTLESCASAGITGIIQGIKVTYSTRYLFPTTSWNGYYHTSAGRMRISGGGADTGFSTGLLSRIPGSGYSLDKYDDNAYWTTTDANNVEIGINRTLSTGGRQFLAYVTNETLFVPDVVPPPVEVWWFEGFEQGAVRFYCNDYGQADPLGEYEVPVSGIYAYSGDYGIYAHNSQDEDDHDLPAGHYDTWYNTDNYQTIETSEITHYCFRFCVTEGPGADPLPDSGPLEVDVLSYVGIPIEMQSLRMNTLRQLFWHPFTGSPDTTPTTYGLVLNQWYLIVVKGSERDNYQVAEIWSSDGTIKYDQVVATYFFIPRFFRVYEYVGCGYYVDDIVFYKTAIEVDNTPFIPLNYFIVKVDLAAVSERTGGWVGSEDSVGLEGGYIKWITDDAYSPYAYTKTAGDLMFSLEEASSAGVSGNIIAVRVVSTVTERLKFPEGGYSSWSASNFFADTTHPIRIRTHDTVYEPYTDNQINAPETYSYTWARNPYTNEPWTVDELNDLEVGLGTDVDTTPYQIECLHFHVQILCAPYVASSSIPAYIESISGTLIRDTNPAYVKGGTISTSNISACLVWSGETSSNNSAYILGIEGLVGSVPAYITSYDVADSYTYAHLVGTPGDISDSKYGFTVGAVSVESSQKSFITGTSEATSSMPAYITSGIDFTSLSADSLVESITSDSKGSGALSISSSSRLVPTMSGSISLVGQEDRWRGAVSYNQGIQLPEGTRQICINPSFEVNTTWWSETKTGITGTTSRSTECSVWGIASAKIEVTNSTATSDYIYLAPTSVITSVDGQSVTCSAWIKTDVLVNAYVSIEMPGYKESTLITSPHDWMRYIITANVGTSFSLRLKVTSTDANAKAIVYFDGVQIENSSYVTPYCDGSLDGSSWAGTVHNSISTRSNAQLYYTLGDIHNIFTYITRFRTPPIVGSRDYTIMQLTEDEYSKNRVDLTLSTEGKLVLDMWDMWGVTKTTLTGDSILLSSKEYFVAVSINNISSSMYCAPVTSLLLTFEGSITSSSTGIRYSPRLYIGTNRYTPSLTFNGVIDDWWFIVDSALTQSQLVSIFNVGPGPYTGTGYGSNCDGTTFAEEGDFVNFNYPPYTVIMDGYVPKESDSSGAVGDDEIRFNIEAENSSDLVSKLAFVQNVSSKSIGQDIYQRETLLRYLPLTGGKQLTYPVYKSVIVTAPNFTRRTTLEGTIGGVSLILARSSIGLTNWAETLNTDNEVNYLDNPVIITLKSSTTVPPRLIVKNNLATPLTDIYYGIAPDTFTPLNFFYDLSDASVALNTSTYTQVQSFLTTFGYSTTRYQVCAKITVSSVAARYNIRLCGGTANFTNEGALILEQSYKAEVANTAILVSLGLIDWPIRASSSLDIINTSSTTFYMGATSTVASTTMKIDYVLFFPAVSAWGHINTTLETGESLFVEPDHSEVVSLDVSGMAKREVITTFEGSYPLLIPGDNRTCVWVAGSAEEEHTLTSNWHFEYRERFLFSDSGNR